MPRASFALVSALALGPFFPPSLVVPARLADARPCSIGIGTERNCALIAPDWVVTTAGAISGARGPGGRVRVHIGDADYAIEQLVYHPRWTGGARFDVALIRLADAVPSFPLLPPPGEFPTPVATVARKALPARAWIRETVGPSLWDDRKTLASGLGKEPAIVTRVRALMELWTRSSSN